jgi:hypothetical protein
MGGGIYLLAQYSETRPTWIEAIAHCSGAFSSGAGFA